MKEYSRRTVNYYDKIAEDYIKSDAAVVLKDKIGEFLIQLSGKKILDVGCGPGHDTNYLTEIGYECLGIDLSPNMIQLARQNNKGSFEVMDFFNMNFEDKSFDGLWCSSVFVHIEKKDLSKFIPQTYRILKDSGILGLITAQKQEKVRNSLDTRKYVMYDQSELEDYLTAFDFRILRSEVFPYGGRNRLFIICKK